MAGRTRPGFGRMAFGTSWTERVEGNRANGHCRLPPTQALGEKQTLYERCAISSHKIGVILVFLRVF